MERREICALIKKHNLEEEVKKQFGDNYTRIPTVKLQQLLYDYDCTLVEPVGGVAPAKKAEPVKPGKVEDPKQKPAAPTNEVSNPYEAACIAFVGILKDSGQLDAILAKL